MPIQRCTTDSGVSGWKWGESGKCYASREDALKQMRAIKYSQTHAYEELLHMGLANEHPQTISSPAPNTK